jgi:hypothetical protein
LRRRFRIREIGATAPDAMVLLGDVGEVQEMGEGTCERCRRVNRKF